ncbi:MAG: hypothetical protein EOM08_13115, partial [Clostridia bacterium]|nr:hypothetical protein [Clostridia bacterium]
LGFYNKPFAGQYFTTENGSYQVEIRVYDEAGGYSTYYSPRLYVDNAKPILKVNKALSDGTSWQNDTWTSQTATFTLAASAEGGGTLVAPVTYWYQIDGGSWQQIFESAQDSNLYRVVIANDTHAIYRFRVLSGTVTAPVWTVYESGRLPGQDGPTQSDLALANTVKVQKTPPRAFSDADFAIFKHVADPLAADAVWTSAILDANSQDSWYNQDLTVQVNLPRPTDQGHPHAPMSTTYTLSKDGAILDAQSGTSAVEAAVLYFQLTEDGTYTITVRTTDAAGNTNASFTKTIRIDDTKPDLQTIKINETFVNWAANLLQTLTYDLFFKQILVSIDVNYDKSGRHSTEGLAYQLVAQTESTMPQADPNGWTQLPLASKTFAFSEDFRGVLYVKAMDKAGNLSDTWLTHGFMSDVTAPDLIVNASADRAVHNQAGGWTANSPAAVTTDWLNDAVMVTLDASDLVGGINTLSQVTYAITTASGTNQTAETVLYQASAAIDPALAPAGMPSQTLTLAADDTYTLVAKAIDRSGNSSTRTLVIRIDRLAPLDQDVIIAINGTDIALAAGETGDPLYLTNGESAVIDATQAAQISGIASIEYQVVEQGEAISDTWAVYSSAAVFKTALDAWSNRIFTLPVRITDRAGNQTELTSRVVYLDNTRPTVLVSGNPANWTDQDVTLVVTAHDYTQFGNINS